jgi:ATP-dependent Zn protease
VRVLLGGRAAEEIIYGSGGITTGASQDLKQVNLLVREMVTGWSFTDKYFGVDYQDMSVLSARQVDREVNRIVQECYADVKALLDIHRVELEMLKQKLCEDEIVDGDWVRTLIKSKDTFCYIEKI